MDNPVLVFENTGNELTLHPRGAWIIRFKTNHKEKPMKPVRF